MWACGTWGIYLQIKIIWTLLLPHLVLGHLWWSYKNEEMVGQHMPLRRESALFLPTLWSGQASSFPKKQYPFWIVNNAIFLTMLKQLSIQHNSFLGRHHPTVGPTRLWFGFMIITNSRVSQKSNVFFQIKFSFTSIQVLQLASAWQPPYYTNNQSNRLVREY